MAHKRVQFTILTTKGNNMQQTETKKLNIYEKILEIRKLVTYFQKGTKGQNCVYVNGATVLGTIRPKMDELGLLLLPTITKSELTNITVTEGSENKEKVKQIVKCDMLFIWVNVENPSERLEVPFASFGMQNDVSMAFGSALTYTERYFLLKFFNIPTDKDDPDAFSEKVGIDDDNVTPIKKGKNISEQLAELKTIDAVNKFIFNNQDTVPDKQALMKAGRLRKQAIGG